MWQGLAPYSRLGLEGRLHRPVRAAFVRYSHSGRAARSQDWRRLTQAAFAPYSRRGLVAHPLRQQYRQTAALDLCSHSGRAVQSPGWRHQQRLAFGHCSPHGSAARHHSRLLFLRLSRQFRQRYLLAVAVVSGGGIVFQKLNMMTFKICETSQTSSQ